MNNIGHDRGIDTNKQDKDDESNHIYFIDRGSIGDPIELLLDRAIKSTLDHPQDITSRKDDSGDSEDGTDR